MTRAERRRLERIAASGTACAVNLHSFLKSRSPKHKPSVMKAKKAEKRKLHREYTTALRLDVFNRAQELCELCQTNYPTEMHHLEGGHGRRRQLQAIDNCMAVCLDCHRRYHRDPLAFHAHIEEWAAEHGYPMPSRFRRSSFGRRGERAIPPNRAEEHGDRNPSLKSRGTP